MNTQFWDEMYRSRDQVFSGAPNGVLVTEVADLPPGRALDVGCGEGADALWLVRRGWQVTAVDISQIALQRAAAAGADLTGRVAWTHGDVTTTPPPVAAFDLVSVQYFPLPHQPDHTALGGLLDAVAPGGTLLLASHDPADLSPRHEHGLPQRLLPARRHRQTPRPHLDRPDQRNPPANRSPTRGHTPHPRHRAASTTPAVTGASSESSGSASAAKGRSSMAEDGTAHRGGVVDARELGEAGLQGWRGRVAERVAPAVSRHTSLDDDQVRRAIGGLFLVLALKYLVKAGRELARR